MRRFACGTEAPARLGRYWDKAKTVIESGIHAGFFAQTQDSIVVYLDALDQRRGG